MTTKDIRTSHAHTVCDVCGRTLLRGERAETYINGGARRSVCELCKTRALHEGWVREGTVPDYDPAAASSDRGRSFLGRLRNRREDSRRSVRARPTLDDELAGHDWARSQAIPDPVAAPDPAADLEDTDLYGGAGDGYGASPADPREPSAGYSEADETEPPHPAGSRRRPARAQRRPASARAQRTPLPREPRHVRAVPTSAEQKIAEAVDLFNQSEHRRTVAGVARSLGGPSVSILPAEEPPSLVHIVVSWELCWYRYAIDLSDDVPGVRMDGQGYELSELSEPERQASASADESGQLLLR